MSKNKIGLITDSTCDLPPALVEKYGIIVVPQILIWGTEEFRDRVTITPDEFYARLAQDPVSPSTSQPVAVEYLKYIEKAKSEGAEEVVIISLSNQLSGTIDSAYGAVEMENEVKVHVYDSLAVSMGMGFQVLAAAQAREAGASAEEMIAAAKKVHDSSVLYVSLDTLEYLHRGGRIGGAAKLVGTALQLKPLIMVDFNSGRLEPSEKTRTRSKAIRRLYEIFFENLDTSKPLHVAVLHGAAPDIAEEFARRIREEYNPVELIVTDVSPVIGVHTGPGAIAMSGYTEN